LDITLALFSALIIAMSLYGAAWPPRILVIARRFLVSSGIWVAAGIRLSLAVLLWSAAPVSLTPVAFRALAFLALLGAVGLPIIGTDRLLKLVDRLEAWPPIVIRLQGIVGVGFGAFILWSVWPALNA
jgi:hypothetical protein